MQVRMLQDAIGPTGTLLRGTTYDLADELARTLKGCGRADYVTAPSQSATPVGDLSSVSGAGLSADGVALYDATTTASATCTIGSATASFTSADIGKVCVVIPYTDTGLTPRYGTITAVSSGTSCTATLSASPGALTGATFIYGTDNKTALDALLTTEGAKAAGGYVGLPLGIICTTGAHVQPSGTTVRGVGNNSSGGKAKDFRHYGTTLVLCSNRAGSALWSMGDISTSSPIGATLQSVNLDCANLATNVINNSASGRTAKITHVTAVRGISETYVSGATDQVSHSCFIGQNANNTCAVFGDAIFGPLNIVTGAGNGYYGVKCSNSDDVLITGNHIWKDGGNATMLGGSIWISHNSGNTLAGSVTVMGNKCDTNYGSAIKITVSGNSSARSIAIIGNDCFNNDNVANNTGPVIELNVGSGSDIRALRIQSNGARSSFNSLSLGQWTYLIDNSASAGTIHGSHVAGNSGHGVNGLYNSFTPTMDGGNLIMAGTGTTVTKSTIA